MKKFNIVHTCFTILFLCLWAYLDFYIELQSIYWLAFELTGFFLIVAGGFFIQIQKREKSIWSYVVVFCLYLINIGYFIGYPDIVKYKRTVCQDKFGREFNNRRRGMGVPGIPDNWGVYLRRDGSVYWKGKEGAIGHVSKNIFMDACTVDFEDDRYNLKPVDRIKRYIDINSEYTKSRDSIFFYYKVGDSTQTISRKQADSIFDAEKINKDY